MSKLLAKEVKYIIILFTAVFLCASAMSIVSAGSRKYDVVVLGATGFTGRLVARYLSENYPLNGNSGVKWALAGRDAKKLQSIKEKFGIDSSVDVLLADSNDAASLDAVAGQTRVVLTTAGPFARIGTPVVDACVRQGTSYCDITGEVQWVRAIIDKHHEEAKSKNIKIVNCCGFDSIPSDLGTQMIINALKERDLDPVEVRYAMADAKGGVSGGTIASAINMIESSPTSVLKDMANPFCLAPRNSNGVPEGATDKAVVSAAADTYSPTYDKVLRRWMMPWVMQGVNTRIVNRSNALLGWAYGRNLIYRELMSAPNVAVATIVSALFPIFGALLIFPPTRRLLKWVLPKPGEGPKEDDVENGYFKIKFWGRGKDRKSGEEKVLQGSVSAYKGDGGYKQTAKFISEAAIALARDAGKLPAIYGVITPAAAFGTVLTDRLTAKGVKFEINP